MNILGRFLFGFIHFILAYSCYVTIEISLAKYIQNKYFTFLHLFLFSLSFISFYRASFQNPGPLNLKLGAPQHNLNEQLIRYCNKCQNNWKPPRAHHCKTCKKCIFRMDHHCEWINNCVGSHNQKFFILFLIYTLLLSISTLAISLTAFILWAKNQKRALLLQIFNLTLNKVNVAIVFFLAIFFIIFTADFLHSQIYTIIDNQTTVESFKQVFGRPGSFCNNAKQIFGKNALLWWLPIKPKLEMNYQELLYEMQFIISNRQGYFEDLFEDQTSQYYQQLQQYRVH